MVVSGPSIAASPPTDHIIENQSTLQAMASLPLLPFATHSGRIVSPFSDTWGFIAFVDMSVSEILDPNGEGDRLE